MNKTPKGPVSLRLATENPVVQSVASTEAIVNGNDEIREIEARAAQAQKEAYARFDVAFKEGLWAQVQKGEGSVQERFEALDRHFYANTRKVASERRRVYERDVPWSELSFSKKDFEAKHAELAIALIDAVDAKVIQRVELTNTSFKPIITISELNRLKHLKDLPTINVRTPQVNERLKQLRNDIELCVQDNLYRRSVIYKVPSEMRKNSLDEMNAIVDDVQSTPFELIPARFQDWHERLAVETVIISLAMADAEFIKEYIDQPSERKQVAQLVMSLKETAKMLEIEEGGELFHAITKLSDDEWQRAQDKTIIQRRDLARVPGRAMRIASNGFRL